MKNADLPAMPQNNSDTLCQQTGTPNAMHSGLTKREYFAGLAMQAAIAAHFDADDVPTYAVGMADKLLTELERTK